MGKIDFVKEVKLKTPLETKAGEIAVIKFRKPKAKDLRGIKLGGEIDFAQILDIAGQISDLPTASMINDLSLEDVAPVVEVVDGFLESFQGTGPQPSER